MSKTVSRAFVGLIGAATAMMSSRQRDKTVSRVLAGLGDGTARELRTRRGGLMFLPLKGPYVASSVANFETDEPETLLWLDDHVREGETLWDVGACVGIYSTYAALRPGVRVVAFEPKAANYGLLVEHIQINGMGERIVPLCIALGDRTCITHLQISTTLVGGAFNGLAGHDNQFGGQESVFSQGVPAMRADDLVEVFGMDPPDHVKLDVDGIEGLILAGAERTLRRVKSILIEVEGANATEAATRLEAPLAAAGLVEETAYRDEGSRRNRLYLRRDASPRANGA